VNNATVKTVMTTRKKNDKVVVELKILNELRVVNPKASLFYKCVIPEGTVHNWVKEKANYISRR
jgi:hypothetical protein